MRPPSAGNCPADPTVSFTQKTRHIDVHFSLEDDAFVRNINWPGSTPIPENQEKCDRELGRKYAAPPMHYNEFDCVPFQGQHWAEDKFENAGTFLFQPALKFPQWEGRPLSWMLGISTAVFDWVVSSVHLQSAEISFPQPEKYGNKGKYPSHYKIDRVEPAKEISGGRTFSVSLTQFEAARGMRGFKR